jgi:hypothetical protein
MSVMKYLIVTITIQYKTDYLNVKVAPLSVNFFNISSDSFFFIPFNKIVGAFSTASFA